MYTLYICCKKKGTPTLEQDKELERLRQKIAYYEAPLPMGKGNCYHRFTDEGICIRCGEDAEEWDAGCVEEIVEDLQSVTTREFADVLRKMVFGDYTLEDDAIVQRYLEKIEEICKLDEFWKERYGVVDVANGADQPVGADSGDFILDL